VARVNDRPGDSADVLHRIAYFGGWPNHPAGPQGFRRVSGTVIAFGTTPRSLRCPLFFVRANLHV
jgi:hypothetical protein